MSNLSTAKMTSRQFLMLGEDPPGVRLELAHGEIVVSPSPSPHHSEIALNLASILRSHVRRQKMGRLFLDTDTIFDDQNTRRPDIAYFSSGRRELIGAKALLGPPDLCVEILSPSDREMDREDKFALYAKRRVPHYWIVDPTVLTIEAYVLERGTYLLALTGKGNAEVRLPPFADFPLPLGEVWPEE